MSHGDTTLAVGAPVTAVEVYDEAHGYWRFGLMVQSCPRYLRVRHFGRDVAYRRHSTRIRPRPDLTVTVRRLLGVQS